MCASREEALSPDELRKRLYQTFKSKGLLDTLKTQLRNQLIQELRRPPPAEPAARVQCDPALTSACNSIVAEHLRKSGYEYSLSVFNPECGLSRDTMLTKQDILQSVNMESSLHKLLLDQENSDKSFLMNLLMQLSRRPTRGTDVVTQTTSLSSHGESLVEKMKLIDKEYDVLKCRGDAAFTLHSKLESYKREIEERLQNEMKLKLQHFKDVELAKVQMDEKAKFNQEFVKVKHELEETYEMKTKALMEREKNNLARLQKQQEIEEKNLYMQRQEVLKEIAAVRNRESELRIKMEAFEKKGQIHEEKVKTKEELLRRREVAVKTLEDTHDQRLRNELSRYQLELDKEFVKRTEKLTENETRNKMETERLLKESAELDSRLEEHVSMSAEIKRLKLELNMAQQQHSVLNEQKELLREKLETMSDYSSLRGERGELQAQLRLQGKELERTQEENGRLQADLQRIQGARRQAEDEWDKQKQVLQAQLQSEMEVGAQLRAQVMDCEEKAKWMKNHVDDIQMQLQQTHTALENEVLRNPKPSLVDRSVLDVCSDSLVPPDVYLDRAALKAAASYRLSTADGSVLRSSWSNAHAVDSDMDLIADAKARMLELQREAEAVEEAYRIYQQRAVVSSISHMLHPRPLSPQYTAPGPDSPLRRQTHHLAPKAISSPPRTSQTSHDSRKLSQSQSKVMFFGDPAETVLPAGFSVGHGVTAQTEHVFERGRHFEDENPVPARRASPPTSPTRNADQRRTHAPLRVLAEDPQLSHPTAVPSGDFLSELSPPRSPQLRSTARDSSSPPELQPVLSSTESSPQPEKLSLEDLTEPLPEQSHIPELLLDTGVGEGPSVPRLQSPQPGPPEAQSGDGQRGHDVQSSGESSSVESPPQQQQEEEEEEEETEEQKWERDRKEKQEQRLREQEEARERELRELERLENEQFLQAEAQTSLKDEVIETENVEKEQEQEAKDDGEACKEEENPLEKYMKMVLEAREKQQTTSPEQEASPLSFDDKSLSEDKDKSVAAFSHKDEEEDFW